jgi:ferredoxin--NADP+ reductase
MELKQSFEILKKETLSPNVKKIVIHAPLIARKAKAGQFVIIIVHEKGERIPLTISDKDIENGTITVIFQEVGRTTKVLGKMDKGSKLFHVLGPLGKPTEIKNYGKVIAVGGGIGIAELYPVVKTLKDVNNFITTIIGARTKELLILENILKEISDKLIITTDDGSYGRKGFVTDALREIIEEERIDLVYAIGPVIMMKKVSELTKPFGIKTIVCLNPIMVDGTGMCGSCRVKVEDKTYFACVDGPDFDGHLVDFDELIKRLNLFKKQEELVKE